MYSRPSAFGPAISGRNTVSGSLYNYENMFTSGVLDSLEGYNWAYTPPYYHGESWVDFIFRPDATKTYTLEDILTETETVYWRVDPGQVSGSTSIASNTRQRLLMDNGFAQISSDLQFAVYGGDNVNKNAMQLDSSLNLFLSDRDWETVIH